MSNRDRETVLRHQQRCREGIIGLLHHIQFPQKSNPRSSAIPERLRIFPFADQGEQVGLNRLERLAEDRIRQHRNFRYEHVQGISCLRDDRQMNTIE
ncbi:hypothetical protein D3C73_557250 [compost metagenome]